MSCAARLSSLTRLAILAAATLRVVQAQALQFNNVPDTITEGTDDVLISWSGGDGFTPVQISLVQDNRVIDTIDDDDDDTGPQTAQWDVELENSIGGYYSLRLVQGTQTVDSIPINIIDEQGRGATGLPPGSTSVSPTAPTPSANSVESASASSAATASTLVTTAVSGSEIVTGGPTPSATGNSTSLADTSSSNNSSGSSGLSPGVIAGIVIGVLVFLTLLVLLIWFVRRRSRRSRQENRMAFNGAEEKHSDSAYATPAALACAASTGTAASGPGVAKSELHAEDKAVVGVHEMDSPSYTASGRSVAGNPGNGPYEMPMPLPPNAPAATAATVGGLAHASSGASRQTGEMSSVSELVGSPSEPGSHSNEDHHRRVSGSVSGSEGGYYGPGVPRKPVGGGGGGDGSRNGGVIHELG